jgi:hypothetical protein
VPCATADRRARRAREREIAVEFETPPQKVLRLHNRLLIPPLVSKGANGLVVASPGVDIVRTLAPNHGDLRPGEGRLQFDYYSAGNIVLEFQSLCPRSVELA